LVHLDIKQLGRFWHVGKHVLKDGVHRSRRAGWTYAHVAVDDHSRYATVELHASQTGAACVAFTGRVIAAYAEQGTPIQRILTDNGTGYRSHAFAALLRHHGIRHIRTRPYTPRTNGKAEAFIRILQREWAYAFIYPTSHHRAKALNGYTRWYNTHRPHGGINGHPPISRISHAARSYT
jgi:transposase InsO family protein